MDIWTEVDNFEDSVVNFTIMEELEKVWEDFFSQIVDS